MRFCPRCQTSLVPSVHLWKRNPGSPAVHRSTSHSLRDIHGEVRLRASPRRMRSFDHASPQSAVRRMIRAFSRLPHQGTTPQNRRRSAPCLHHRCRDPTQPICRTYPTFDAADGRATSVSLTPGSHTAPHSSEMRSTRCGLLQTGCIPSAVLRDLAHVHLCCAPVPMGAND